MKEEVEEETKERFKSREKQRERKTKEERGNVMQDREGRGSGREERKKKT